MTFFGSVVADVDDDSILDEAIGEDANSETAETRECKGLPGPTRSIAGCVAGALPHHSTARGIVS
jgi:hypothetical protein